MLEAGSIADFRRSRVIGALIANNVVVRQAAAPLPQDAKKTAGVLVPAHAGAAKPEGSG